MLWAARGAAGMIALSVACKQADSHAWDLQLLTELSTQSEGELCGERAQCAPQSTEVALLTTPDARAYVYDAGKRTLHQIEHVAMLASESRPQNPILIRDHLFLVLGSAVYVYALGALATLSAPAAEHRFEDYRITLALDDAHVVACAVTSVSMLLCTFSASGELLTTVSYSPYTAGDPVWCVRGSTALVADESGNLCRLEVTRERELGKLKVSDSRVIVRTHTRTHLHTRTHHRGQRRLVCGTYLAGRTCNCLQRRWLS